MILVALLMQAIHAGPILDIMNRGRRFCDTGDIYNILHANCDEFDGYAMRHCLRQYRMDPIIAKLVQRCPFRLPSNRHFRRRFDDYAERLVNTNMSATFRALIGDGRCSELTEQGRIRLRMAIDRSPSAPAFMAAYQQSCAPLGLGARTVGIAGPGIPVAQVYRGAHGGHGIAAGALVPSPAWSGPVEFINEVQVRQDFTILTRISPNQAPRFGLLNTACRGLTEAHFRQPGVSADTVANLPVQCFRQIPPPAFAGMTAIMVAKTINWPYATPEQIKFVRTGDPIRAVPFDQLGLGRQYSRWDRFHPCHGVTREQRRSINRSLRARREFYRRCLHSGAAKSGRNAGDWKTTVLPSILVGLFLVFF